MVTGSQLEAKKGLGGGRDRERGKAEDNDSVIQTIEWLLEGLKKRVGRTAGMCGIQ